MTRKKSRSGRGKRRSRHRSKEQDQQDPVVPKVDLRQMLERRKSRRTRDEEEQEEESLASPRRRSLSPTLLTRRIVRNKGVESPSSSSASSSAVVNHSINSKDKDLRQKRPEQKRPDKSPPPRRRKRSPSPEKERTASRSEKRRRRSRSRSRSRSRAKERRKAKKEKKMRRREGSPKKKEKDKRDEKEELPKDTPNTTETNEKKGCEVPESPPVPPGEEPKASLNGSDKDLRASRDSQNSRLEDSVEDKHLRQSRRDSKSRSSPHSSRSRSGSLSLSSLSPSPSPERRPPPPSPPSSRREAPPRSPPPRRPSHEYYRRPPPPPPHWDERRRHSFEDSRLRDYEGPGSRRYSEDSRGYEHRRDYPPPRESWEDKVRAFVEKTKSGSPEATTAVAPTVSPTPPIDTSVPPPNMALAPASATPKVKDESPAKVKQEEDAPPPPGLDEEDPSREEDKLKRTPLVRYIGKKLSRTKRRNGSALELRLEGAFSYNILSVLTRHEWVAARTLKLLEDAGYGESRLLHLARLSGKAAALETELKSAVFTGKVALGGRAELVAQVMRVIEHLVRYLMGEGGEEEEEEEESGKEEQEDREEVKGSNAMRRGVGETLKQLAKKDEEERLKKEQEEATSSFPSQDDPMLRFAPQQNNPWTHLWDRLQSDGLRSLADMKVFIAKDLLRLGDPKLCPEGQKAFNVAQDMVVCLVVAGCPHGTLRHMVMQAQADDIIPPKEQTVQQRGHRRFVYDVVMSRLESVPLGQMPEISRDQLDYLVRKALTYVMRGCDKVPSNGPAAAAAKGAGNVVFDYLPAGLREMENQAAKQAGLQVVQEEEDEDDQFVLEEGQTPQNPKAPSAEDKESTDPLNAILNPESSSSSSKSDELPPRKYLVGSVHAEWLVLRGRPQLYEIGVHFGGGSPKTETVYMVPEAMQRQPPEVLDALGFVANPDRPEFYFVQVGVGVIKTLTLEKAVQKLVRFLEERRQQQQNSESRNNGLVLNFYGEEEMAVVAEAFEKTGHKNVFLDCVKGLGCVETFQERNRSKNLSYSGPKVSVGAADCFFRTEVRRGVAATELVSRSKAEALHQAVEFFLEGPATYRGYVKEHCFPSLGPRADAVRRRHRACADMFHLEVFMAAQLKAQRAQVYLEGVFASPEGAASRRELRDRYSLLASRVCRALVAAGFDLGSLRRAHERDPEFAVNSAVFLDRGSTGVTQRLKLMDQTVRCVRIVQEYFRPPQVKAGGSGGQGGQDDG